MALGGETAGRQSLLAEPRLAQQVRENLMLGHAHVEQCQALTQHRVAEIVCADNRQPSAEHIFWNARWRHGSLVVGSGANYIVRNRTKGMAMNLYLRLLWALLRAWRRPRLLPGAMFERVLRVWPTDLDIIGHMNNARYLAMVDLMLVEYFVRSGLARAMLRAGWRPMSGGAIITYRKSLQPFQRYRLRFSHDVSDLHWNYMRFEFVREDGVLCATGMMKGAVVSRSGLVPNAESWDAMGHQFTPKPLPANVEHWLAAERGLVDWARGTVA